MVNLERLLRMSSSKLADFSDCERKFEYKNIFRLPFKTLPLAFGGAVHHLIDKFWENNFESPESFAKFAGFYWSQLWFSQEDLDNLTEEQVNKALGPKQKLTNSLRKTLESMRSRYGTILFYGKGTDTEDGVWWGALHDIRRMTELYAQDHLDERMDLEKRRIEELEYHGIPTKGKKAIKGKRRKDYLKQLDLYPKIEERFELMFDGHFIVGRIDKLESRGGVLHAVDYKSGRSVPEENDFVLLMEGSHQSTIYELALQTLSDGTDLEPGEFAIYHLRTGKQVPLPRRARDYEFLKKDLRRTVDGIVRYESERENSDQIYIYPKNVTYDCHRCEFKAICAQEERALRDESTDSMQVYFQSILQDNQNTSKQLRERATRVAVQPRLF